MKVVFMGSPEFAVEPLKGLWESPHMLLSVVAPPDKPQGRGMKLVPSPIKVFALEHALTLLQPLKASEPEFIEKIKELAPDTIVVVAYGQLIKPPLLQLPPCGCINIHPSLLPRYRGPSPIPSAILAGEAVTGVSAIRMDEGMDTGDILQQAALTIEDDDTSGSLERKLSLLSAKLLVETLDGLERGHIIPKPQDYSLATYTHKIVKADGHIDWTEPARRIHNRIRAMQPWPGAYSTIDGNLLKLCKSQLLEDLEPHQEAPGKVLSFFKDGLLVSTGEGEHIIVSEVQSPGGRRMPVEDFMRGHPYLKPGAFFQENREERENLCGGR